MENLNTTFSNLFGDISNSRLFFAPGRVNLIGEHTDYNGGNVFPCALDIGTYALARESSNKKCRFYSLNFDHIGIIEFNLDDLLFDENHNWANYPKGVIVEFAKLGLNLNHGFDIVFYGNIPNGAGLSSSASIEVLMGTILNAYLKSDKNGVDIALIGQAAENKYIGVGCGIMDQFASAMGKNKHAILLDCNTLKYQYAPFELSGYKIVIANTNKRRGLADSKYNERLAECKEALKIAQTKHSILSLGELNNEQLIELEPLFDNKIVYRRAYHAVTENQRTLKAVEALSNNDLMTFGKLMADSHISLRDDYEVTGIELDSLVKNAWDQDGCIGARMTGAGFGGCTVNIVSEDKVDNFIKNVGNIYTKETGLIAEFYIVNPSDGAREII
ncbi:MAG: galactokinase [Burkholderiales bacterium]|nr:galactokinase [Burkholderiales bacterium]